MDGAVFINFAKYSHIIFVLGQRGFFSLEPNLIPGWCTIPNYFLCVNPNDCGKKGMYIFEGDEFGWVIMVDIEIIVVVAFWIENYV